MSENESKQKKGMNVYVLVFGIIVVIVAIAAASTLVFNKNLASVSLSNLNNYGLAPNITGVSQWINSQPLTMQGLKGKVVLVDFWTYSCINCIRSIPYLEAWQKEYGSDGLVIIGVHTPEFQFEHNFTNVAEAVKRFNITYPVVLDNNYTIWNAYSNQYWPADYLVDKNGYVRYLALGEGDYNQTNAIIRELLENASYTVPTSQINVTSATNFSQIGSPEIYLGYAEAESRGESLGNPQGFSPNQTVNYTAPVVSQNNTVYLSGSWYNAPYYVEATGNSSRLFLIFKAKNLNIVASGSGSPSRIALRLDGEPLPENYFGTDVASYNGSVVSEVNGSRLYDLVNAPTYGWHELEIDASPGLRIYTFTFG